MARKSAFSWTRGVKMWIFMSILFAVMYILSWWWERKRRQKQLVALNSPSPPHCSSEATLLIVICVQQQYIGSLKQFMQECYNKAECRLRLRFGLIINEQFIEVMDIIEQTQIPKHLIQYVKVPQSRAQGELRTVAYGYPRLMRYRQGDVAPAPVFSLFLDMRVVSLEQNWDSLCVDMWSQACEEAGHRKVLLTGIPGSWMETKPNYVSIEYLDPQLALPVYVSRKVISPPRKMMKTLFWSSRFSFGPSDIFETLAFDPHFKYFSLSAYDFPMSVRLQKAGIALYHPNKVVSQYVFDFNATVEQKQGSNPFQLVTQPNNSDSPSMIAAELNKSISRLRLFFHCEPESSFLTPAQWTLFQLYGFSAPKKVVVSTGGGSAAATVSKPMITQSSTWEHFGVDVARTSLSVSAHLGLSKHITIQEAEVVSAPHQSVMDMEEIACKFPSILAFQQIFSNLDGTEKFNLK